MSERYLHLCDVVDGRSDVPAGCFADGGSSIAAGLELLAALKGDSAHRTTGLAADEQTGAAETVEFLNLGGTAILKTSAARSAWSAIPLSPDFRSS